jgi:flavin reductase (DIM6/NTAB) family NADH-FMN oxidoreductase RutF
MLLKSIFFKQAQKIQTFLITRLRVDEIDEQVFLQAGQQRFDITGQHGMICLDPFCMSIWLPQHQLNSVNLQSAQVQFIKKNKLNARIKVILSEKIITKQGALLLYKIEAVKNYQLSALQRLVYWGYFLRSKANTYYSRKVISALYSYPRSIIIVSYRDADYYNIFPMDIHNYIEQEDMYLLGLRTTNVTLDKILHAKKVVICDTDAIDIDTIYNLGKHSSKAPTPINELPFQVIDSEVHGFPIPDFVGSYKEVEIVSNKKLGYHMMLVGKVVNHKVISQNSSSLYHVGFLQSQTTNYKSIEGIF